MNTETKKILWLAGSMAFALAGAGALLSAIIALGFHFYQDWEYVAGDGPVHIDLGAPLTTSLVFCLALGVLALGGLVVSLVCCGRPVPGENIGAASAPDVISEDASSMQEAETKDTEAHFEDTGHSTLPRFPVHLTWFDRIFTEVHLLVGTLAGCGLMPAGLMMENWAQFSPWVAKVIWRASGITTIGQVKEGMAGGWGYLDEAMLEPNAVTLVLALVIAVCMLAIIALVLQAIVKKIKNRGFWRGTLIGWLILQAMTLVERSTSLTRKVFAVVIIAVLLSMSWFGAIIVIACACIFLPRYLRQFQQIREGTARIRSGELTYRIPVMQAGGGLGTGGAMNAGETEPANGELRREGVPGARQEDAVKRGGELTRLAEDINAISSAQYAAIQKELKTQRMQTDLITNVSHDLKTPLTSMVNYVDLLKREGLDGEHAPEYLEVLDEKTQRLKKLSEDLFEAAKASSGSIPVHLEPIDAQAAVNQALGEMEEALAAREVTVLVNPRTEDALVLADGRHLWRVIENLLSNIGKYAMPGSRAYIDIEDGPDFSKAGRGCLQVTVKNMSAEPLNISPEELMERFTRGDASRSSEGSGLGLGIARDLVRVMGGRFDLAIDGDLFKVTIQLPKAEGPGIGTD